MSPRTLTSASLKRHLGGWRAPGAGPGYRQLAGTLRLLILDGRLPLEVGLPGERDLAEALDLSRTTVGAAYGVLRDEGFLVGPQGAVARTALPSRSRSQDRALGARKSLRHPVHGDAANTPSVDGMLDMTCAVMSADASVHAAYMRALERLPASLPGHGYEAAGLEDARAAVAAAYGRRGLPTSPEQILITHGAHNALAHMLRLKVRPGDPVVIDHPTYLHAIDAIRAVGARPAPVGLPDDPQGHLQGADDPSGGWDMEGLIEACRRSAAPLAYLVLDHHNPTGRLMGLADRTRLFEETRGSRTLLVLDETLIDLTLSGTPAVAAARVDAPHVVRLGSMSKSVWGGLRIGWVRADPLIIQALAIGRSGFDLGVPVLEQLAAVELLNDGGASLTQRRPLLRARRDHLLSRLAERLPTWQCPRPAGGLSIWAKLPEPISSALVASAEDHGVRVAAGPRFGIDGAFERHLRIPFTLPEADLDLAVERLAAAYERLDGSAKPVRARRAVEPVY